MKLKKIKDFLRNASNRNKKVKKIYEFLNYIKVNILKKMSDEKFARMKYYENTGKTLDLKNPKTFNEKLWWLKLNNRDPLLTICSDKYRVREYIKNCGLEKILIKLHGVYDNVEEITFSTLPDKVFFKTNHGSGKNCIYNKNKDFNYSKFNNYFSKALKANYYLQSREWNYKNIPPKILAEEILETKGKYGLVDYKILCFNGKVRLIFVELGICSDSGEHNPFSTRNVYNENFEFINMKVGRDNFDKDLILKPQNFELMIKYAETLSAPFPHCRVDLYNLNGNIFFGEMTFYHGGCTQEIIPIDWSYRMGEWIDLKNKKIKVKI